jgi:hypothetical protein
MNKIFILIAMIFAISCTKPVDDCKPISCQLTQTDYTVCWTPDNKHQYVQFDEPESFTIETDECELNTFILPTIQLNDTLGIYKYPVNVQIEIKSQPTTCDCQ